MQLTTKLFLDYFNIYRLIIYFLALLITTNLFNQNYYPNPFEYVFWVHIAVILPDKGDVILDNLRENLNKEVNGIER